MSSLHLYETMSGLTAQMVLAARENDWDRLTALEADVASLRNLLSTEDPIDAPTDLSDAERERKIALIQRMLEDDRNIRCYTEPWMASVRKFLSSSQRTRNVRLAYGALGE